MAGKYFTKEDIRKMMTEKVKDYDEDERRKKRFERMHNHTDFEDKAISEPMKESLANYIKKQRIPGLKRFKVSDIEYGYYDPYSDEYNLKIRINRIRIKRSKWSVMVF